MIFQDIAAYRAANFSPKVAVIGSGPAGMSVARVLAAKGVPVVMLEAGGEDFSDASQDFYKGATIGDPYFQLDVTRLRYLGGSSNHWAGWCRMLDQRDFEAKAWAPDTGWPIGRAAIEPYFDAVREILELPPLEPDQPLSEEMKSVQLIKSPAVRFGQKYRREIADSDKIALVLNTYASELRGDGARVTGAKLISRDVDGGELVCDSYVACAGGLENSRLLLWSNERSNGAVVPQARALGRYWMEHPEFFGGDALLVRDDVFKLDADKEAFFAPTLAAMEKHRILNIGICFMASPYSGMKKTIADLACVAPSTAEWLAKMAGAKLLCGGKVSVAWEQAPVESNRVALSTTARDRAGVPRIELHWRKQEIDRRTLKEGMLMYGRSLAARNLGRVRLADWVTKGGEYPTDQELAGHHHMGGTRMHDDPAKGVVDADCKVHGMENLYVGGSSVFTTSGYANPTATLVALAVRLGHHLATRPGLKAPAH